MPPSRGPAPRETHESRCPYCRSYRITRAGYIVVTGGMLKEAHRCEVCNTAFLLVHPAIG
jgi:transposase-like protein